MIWRGSRPIVGLVEHQDLGVVDQRLREPDALAEALRKMPHEPTRDVREPGSVHDALARRGTGRASAPSGGRRTQIERTVMSA
jgi:hypothetical protein